MQFVSSIIFIHSLPLNTADREIAIRSKLFSKINVIWSRERERERTKKAREKIEEERRREK